MVLRGLSMFRKGRPKRKKKYIKSKREENNDLHRNINVSRKDECSIVGKTRRRT
jgi:hypothetical protein